jgi:ATP-dependent exoDNAse (exonuclease V) beta subunit
MVEETLALEGSYISTIHALGQRLLTEHAFAVGGSPGPKLLEQAEGDYLIRRAMAGSVAFSDIYRDLARFGFRFSGPHNPAPSDQLRGAVRATIDQLRALGEAGMRPEIANESVADLARIYGEVEPDGAALDNALHDAVQALLEVFPDSIADGFTGNASATKAFRANHTALRKASDRADLACDWKLWKDLRKLRLTMRGTPTPEGYDALAEAVMEAADGIQRHPGPLADATWLLRRLIHGAQGIITEYAALKQRIGVVDYADMVAGAEALLRSHPNVLDAVLDEIDCVVIDEFQDTNPVQFAFLWTLAKRAPHTILVGDAKQSIMGFQGADVRLTEALVDRHTEAVEHLPFNWRSNEQLVGLFNAVSTGFFGDSYFSAKAKRPTAQGAFFEVLKCPNARGSGKGKALPHHVVALRVEEMLKSKLEIIDPDTKEPRAVLPNDIAVLALSHSKLAHYTRSLRALNIPVQTEVSGWFDSPAVQLARFAIAYAADPTDAHAALGWLTLGPEAMPVEVAMQQLSEGTLGVTPALKPLATLAPLAVSLRCGGFVAQVLAQSGLERWVLGQPDPKQLRADLARLRHQAQLFEELEAELLATTGFFGAVPQVFLGWLAARKDEKGADARPQSGGLMGQGVEIVTWFSAKGREWPVVIVAQLDEKFAARAGGMRAEFEHFDDLDNVLEAARIGHFPRLDVDEKTERYAEHLRPESERNARRLLYVAMTRARDRLLLEWPEKAIGKTSAGEDRNYVDLLIEEGDLVLGEGKITVGGEDFSAEIRDGLAVYPDVFDTPPPTIWPEFLRFDASGDSLPDPITLWRQQPSSMEGVGDPVKVVDYDLGAAAKGLGLSGATERGTAAHLALRAFLADPAADLDVVASASGLAVDKVGFLRAQAIALARWLQAQGYPKLHLELPMQRADPSGARMNAIIDCLAVGENGVLIVDHKTGAVADTGARFGAYYPQLDAYAGLVRTAFPDKRVQGLVINWVDTGVVSLCRMEAPVTA